MGGTINPISGMLSAANNAPNSASGAVNTVGSIIKDIGAGADNTKLTNELLWPIRYKTDVAKVRDKLNPLGVKKINTYYTDALTQGRLFEKSLGSAQYHLLLQKKTLMEHINHLFLMNSLAVDGQLGELARKPKYVADAISILKAVNGYQQEIMDLIQAVTTNIGILQSMVANMAAAVQTNLNALATLMNEICNWGLPDVPALPNFFGDTVWRWNGFQFFPPQSFVPQVGFDFNFAFNQCQIHIPNLDIFRNYPSSISDGQGLVYGQPPFIPPLGGKLPTGGQLSDPNFVSMLESDKDTPYFYPGTNPHSCMWGSVPNPVAIISNYHMPPDVFHNNIISILPATRYLTIEPGDPKYGTVITPSDPLNTELRKELMHSVTLDTVVASNFDPILTSTWLLYISSARTGRGGNWLPNLQTAYNDHLTGSINQLSTVPIPWNTVVNGSGTEFGPSSLPLITELSGMSPDAQTTLWKLSYVEASLLGYPRSQTWDAYADPTYVSSFTADALDYIMTPVDLGNTTTLTLGAGEAEYPVTCTFPVSMASTLNEVISLADANIKLATTWKSSKAELRYVFDQFAQAKEVDRFSQFWREFNSNLIALLAQDPYILQYVASYTTTLDSAIDPLGDSSIYEQVELDAVSRNRSWVPGYPLLPIPQAPIVVAASDSAPNATGWTPTADPNVQNFDPVVFLSRPDIQSLSIPVQMAMLTTNQTAASLMQFQQNLNASVKTQIDLATQTLQDFENVGFSVSMVTPEVVTIGYSGMPVAFDKTEFDLTNNVTTPSLFTIQSTGNYAIIGQLNWGSGDAGVRSVTVMSGEIAVLTSSINSSAPSTLVFSGNVFLNQGETLTVMASHNLTTGQELEAGSYFSVTKFSDTNDTEVLTPPPPQDTGSTLLTMVAAVDIPVSTVLVVNSAGQVAPLDPTQIQKDSGGNVIYPYADGFAISAGSAGASIEVGNLYGEVYTVTGANFVPGGLIYVAKDGTMTQDFNSILGNVQWIVCVGKAVTATTIIYQPHIPSRSVMRY